MARRRKSSPRRRSRSVSLLNVAESYAYANVLTSGLMGTTPVGFITGDTDLKMGSRRIGSSVSGYTMEAYGQKKQGKSSSQSTSMLQKSWARDLNPRKF